MKTRNLLRTTILALSLMVNQFADAQVYCPPQPCSTGKVWACRYNRQCQIESKCINVNNVASWLAHGVNVCECNPCGYYRLEDTNPDLASFMEIYPNPVSNSATLLFSLEQTGKISLKIFDLNGRLISVIVDGEMNEGEYELEWNAVDVKSGVYFLRFQSADTNVTRQLIVVNQ